MSSMREINDNLNAQQMIIADATDKQRQNIEHAMKNNQTDFTPLQQHLSDTYDKIIVAATKVIDSCIKQKSQLLAQPNYNDMQSNKNNCYVYLLLFIACTCTHYICIDIVNHAQFHLFVFAVLIC
jgi:hypothetical protein